MVRGADGAGDSHGAVDSHAIVALGRTANAHGVGLCVHR